MEKQPLMARRIRRILLVCNNYDNFSLERKIILMRRFFLICSTLMMVTACSQREIDSASVKAAVSSQLEVFPESRLQDLYKSFFQDRFGPGHIISDRQSALNYILSELASADSLPGPRTETCGWEGNYVRVNLSAIADGLLTAEELTDALMASAKAITDTDLVRWKREWAAIESIIEATHPDLPGLTEDKAKIAGLLSSGQYACHHSAAYNAAYHPHYRIIAREFVPKCIFELK